MSDRGTHFINETFKALIEEFQVHHARSTPYHPQVNGIVEAFKNILEHVLTKVCNAQQSEWDSPEQAKVKGLVAVLKASQTEVQDVKAEFELQLTYLQAKMQPKTPP